jgi:hypothetical protein
MARHPGSPANGRVHDWLRSMIARSVISFRRETSSFTFGKCFADNPSRTHNPERPRPMIRSLTAAATLALLSTLAVPPAFAAASAPAAKAKTTKKASPVHPVEEPVSATNDNLNPGQLTMADRVLTGVADCEFKQKVTVEKIEGHNGNFKLTFDRKSYIMVPEETTTGAIRLVDTGGAVVWVQIPKKSMLMNQKEHHRMVDDCQADEQRIASQSAAQAGANAPFLAPSVATPASAAAVAGTSMPPAAAAAMTKPVASAKPAARTTTTSTTTTTTTISVVPPAPVQRAAQAPDAAASGMWK